ncbi:FtsX-like permease family protein [Catenulispora subtropica]|uniref:ABC transporter permease n=1 Tax=Catenulispora subtropica TaxID=450798 RepID=A0ABN2RW48_9ACTN
MLSIALSTVRVRWVSFVGTLVALTCGVALMATAILVIHATGTVPDEQRQRYSGVPVVVLPATAMEFAGAGGHDESFHLGHPHTLPADLVAAAAATGRVVADHTFYAQLAGGPADQVGRGWSAAEPGGYRLLAGRAPAGPGEVVVGGGDPALVGRSVPLTTAAGPRTVTVTGVTDSAPFEHAVFFSDAEAAALSPDVDALGVYAPEAAVRQALTPWSSGLSAVTILSGPDRSAADPHHVAVAGQLQKVEDPLGLAAGVAGFVAIFVVAGTFALSIAQRRRELALLRMVGATRRQMRRLVRFEALLVGLFASVIGCAVSVATGPLCGRWLVDHDLVPAGFTVSVIWWGLLVAALTGMTTALVGVLVSAVRAGVVSPADALREAASERRQVPVLIFRWLVGGAVLIGGLIAEGTTAFIRPESGADAAAALALVLINVGAFAVLGGVLAKPVTGLLTAVPSAVHALLVRRRAAADGSRPGTDGATWEIARQTAATAFGRTAATTTPVVIIIALAGSLLGTVATINAGQVTATREELAGSDYVVSPAGTPGLSQAVVQRIRSVPDTTALVVTPIVVYTEQSEGHGENMMTGVHTSAVDAAALPVVTRLPVASGSLAGLGPDSIVVGSSWPGSPKAGRTVSVWLPDGTARTLMVAAVLKHSGSSAAQAYVDSSLAGSAMASRVQVKVAPGADLGKVLAGLRSAVAGAGAQVRVPDQVATQAMDANEKASWTGMEMILGLSVLYAAIALANTLVMTVSDRKRELVLLRLVGATKGQVLRVVAVETLMCLAAGAVVGALAVAISIGGAWAALSRLVGATPAVVPWAALGGLFGACVLIGLVAAVVPVGVVLRGTQERGLMEAAVGEAG